MPAQPVPDVIVKGACVNKGPAHLVPDRASQGLNEVRPARGIGHGDEICTRQQLQVDQHLDCLSAAGLMVQLVESRLQQRDGRICE